MSAGGSAQLPNRAGVLTPVPAYQSVKIVNALEIAHADMRLDGSVMVHFVEDFAPIHLAAKVVARHMPIPRDRLVIYEDGYMSISPRPAFEGGYKPL